MLSVGICALMGWRMAAAQPAAPPKEVALRGKLVCLNDEMRRLYKADAECRSDGHRGALRTPDGSLYTLLPNTKSYVLILEPQLMGREVEIRGRLFPKSMVVEVFSHQVFDEKGRAFTAYYWCDL